MGFLKKLFGLNRSEHDKKITKADLDKQLRDAASNGNIPEIERLIKNGADVNAKDQFTGSTVLHNALSSHNSAVTKLLLSLGANPNQSDDFGEPVLIKAALANQHEVVKVLLDNGADINIKDRKGNTALLVAVKEGQGWTNVVEVLIAGGASPEAVGTSGESALSIARRRGFDSLVHVLTSRIKTRTEISAPKGVYCVLCQSRYSIAECIDPKVPEGRIITFVCPKCKVPRAYDPVSDQGL